MSGINLSSSTSIKTTKKGGVFDSSFAVIVVIFFLVVAGFGGLRFYIKTLDTKISALKATLEENSAQLQGRNVDRVAHFDSRLRLAGEQSSGNGVDSQKLLDQLESLIVPNIRLTKYEYNETEKFVEVAGEAESFKYVAQQIVSFKSENTFVGIKVQSLARTTEGRIAFSLKADLN